MAGHRALLRTSGFTVVNPPTRGVSRSSFSFLVDPLQADKAG